MLHTLTKVAVLILIWGGYGLAAPPQDNRAVNPVQVWISDGHAGEPGDTVTIPVVVGEILEAHYIEALELEILYDTNALTYTGFSVGGSALQYWDLLVDNEPSPGRILFSGASTAGTTLSVDDTGYLVFLNFTVPGGAPVGCTALTLEPTGFQFNAGEPTSTLSNGQFCVSAGPEPVADLALAGVVSPEVAAIGDTLSITWTVTNDGPDTATGITVDALLPAGFGAIANDSGGAYNENTGVWDVGTLVSGESASLMVTARFDAQDQATAQITASDVNDPDSTPNNGINNEDDSASVSVREPAADLDLTVRVSNTAPFEGEQVSFTLTLTNQGPDTASQIEIDAPLPVGLDTVVRDGAYTNGVWTIPNLAAEASTTLTIVAVGNTAGSYTLTAEVTAADVTDPDATPNNGDPTEDDLGSATVLVRPAVGAAITFVSGNLNGVGLTDTTPVDPVGGNPGTTLGEQRRIALEHAASIWGAYLISDVPIRVRVEFVDGDCTGSDGFLLRGTPVTAGRAFSPGNPTWYPVALANAIKGADQNAQEEIILLINSAPDTSSCRSSSTYYYGLNADPNGSVDFVTQALRELAHGLGLSPMVNASSGAELSGADDIFSTFVEDHNLGKTWNQMSNSERLASAADPSNLHWIGPRTLNAATERLNDGFATDNHLPLVTDDFRFDYVGTVAPDRYMFSLDRDVNPDESLEDGLTSANHDPGLAAEMLYDLGWVPRRQADLRVDMTVSNPAAVPAEDIVFTITVTNEGPDDATEVAVTNRLPGGLRYTTHATATGSYAAGNGIWTIGNLNAGDTAVLEITVEVQATGLKENVVELTHVAEADPDSFPNNGLTNEDDYAAVSVGSADLSLTLETSNAAPSSGDTVTLSITVVNHGADTATGIVVKDLLSVSWPPPLVHLSDNSGGTYDTGSGKWRVGTLASGQSAELNIEVRVDAESPVTNTAEIYSSDLADPDSTPNNNDPAEDDYSRITLAVPNADLSLAFGDFTDLPNPGDTIDVDLTINNAGPDAATSVRTQLTLSSGLSYVNHAGNGSYNAATGQWSAGTVNPGVPETITFTLSVDGAGIHTINAEVAQALVLDPDSEPNNADPSEDDTDSLFITTAKADLNLSQTVLNGTANAGDDVTFILQLFNNGPQDATNISVAHLIPAGMSYRSHSGDGTYNSGSGVWDIDSLDSGSTASVSVVARVDLAGTHIVTAEVSAADQVDPDSTPGNGPMGEDDDARATVGKVDVSVSLAVTDATPFVSDQITFTLTVANAGPEDATNVTINTSLGAGLTRIDGDRSGTFVWNPGTVPSGTDIMTQFSATVDSTGGKFVTAEVVAVDHFDTDSTPNNGVIGEDDTAQLLIAPKTSGSGARILIVNMDSAGEGFNDPTPATPAGGNTGTTLGAQRLQAFAYAASIWAANISSDVVIEVAAWFDPLFCSSGGAILGQAAPWTVSRDFPNAPKRDTWYAIATANAISGRDLNGGDPEIYAQFNSNLDSGCLSGKTWYYGFDRAGGNQFDAVSTILHEIGHGLGFLSLTQSNGARFLGKNDIYAFFLEDHSQGLTWNNLSDSQRAQSVVDTHDLHWTGPNVVANSGHLTTGRHSSGHVEMYAPNPIRQGSSTSHFSTRLSPNDLMEPFATGADHDVSLTAQLMLDIGWPGRPTTDLEVMQSVDKATPEPGDLITFAITVTNGGPAQTQDVSASLQADAGLVYQGHFGDGSFDNATGDWEIGLMETGDQFTLNVTYLVDSLDPLDHHVEITGSLRPDPDSTPNNGSTNEDDDDTLTVEPFFVGTADLSLSLAVDNLTPDVLDTLTFSLAVNNAGPDPAGDVKVLFQLPAGLTYLSDTGDYDPARGIWTVGSIAVTTAETIDITCTVADAGTKTAIAEVFLSASDDPDSTPDNRDPSEDDRDLVTIDAQPLGTADLSLVMGVNEPNPDPGDTITVTIDLANDGPDTAESVIVAVFLPPDYAMQGSAGDGAFSGGNWTVGNIVAGDSKTLTVDLRADSPGAKLLSAEVGSVLQDDPDSTPANGNAAEDDTDRLFVQVPEADLALTMSVSDPVVTLDDHVTFNLVVSNTNGPFDADGIGVTVNMPPGLSYVDHTGDGTYTSGSGLWIVGALPSGASAGLALEVSVDQPGARMLQAEITAMNQFDSDSTPNNGNATEDDHADATVTTRATGGATIVILNADAAGEGFNDPTSASPVGGNPGTTIGQQRLNAFQYAADILGQLINSDVTIVVESNFDPLSCSSASAVLGSAGPKNVSRNFPGAPEADTWYHMALANALSGIDLNGDTAEIRARFNSSMDNNNSCLSGTGWYYGLDGNPGNHIDLVSVLLHEFSHGLGFSTFVSPSGQRFLGMNDVYMKRLEDHATGTLWSNLSDQGRAASAVRTGQLHWTGPAVTNYAGVLNDGVSGGHMEMFAPNPYQSGSSVSHFTKDTAPNELMEPSYTGPNHDLGMALALFTDIGWNAEGRADLSLGLQVDHSGATPGDTVTFTLSVSNDGPEDAGGITVAALLPDGFGFSNASGDGTYNDGTGEWDVGTLFNGETAVLQIQAVVGTGEKTFSAEITASDTADADSTPGNGQPGEDDTAEASVGSADISVAVTASDLTPDEGSLLTLSIDVVNAGPDITGNVTVRAPLPAGLSLSTVNQTGYDPTTGIWHVGDLNGTRSTAGLIIEAVVTSDTLIDFQAELLTSSLADPDSVPGNGQPGEDDHARITLVPVPQPKADLSLTLTADDAAPFVGEPTTLRFTADNAGPETPQSVAVTIVLPAAVHLIEALGDGSYTNGTWTPPTLGPGSSASLALLVYSETAGVKAIEAEITSSGLPDPDSIPANGSTTEDDDVRLELLPRVPVSTEIMILNADAPGEGFNDNTAVTPVGGNPGTTLGEQRLIAFRYAADIWASLLDVQSTVVVRAKFDPLQCSSSSGVLGAAGPNSVERDFPGAPIAGTWYHAALAHSIAGSDLNGSAPEINATFNSQIDNNSGCLNGTNWYYGLDAQPPGTNIDLVSVLLHEFAHGLGFSTLVNSSGQTFNNVPDVFASFLEDHSLNKNWTLLTNAQRAASARDNGDLHWAGISVNDANSSLTSGVRNGHVEMYAPTNYAQGSSVSHFSTSLAPNELMEPSYTGPNHDVGLALNLMEDIGWGGRGISDLSLTLTVDDASPDFGDTVTFTITLTNDGPDDLPSGQVGVPLQAGLTYVSDNGGGDYADEVWNIDALASGADTVLTISATVHSGSAMTVGAQVLKSASADPDSTPNNGIAIEDDYDAVTIVPTGAGTADLRLTLTVDDTEPELNTNVVYTITVHNDGPDTATNLNVSFANVPGLQYVSATDTFDPPSGTWSLGSLPSGDSAALVLTMKVTELQPIQAAAEVLEVDQDDPDSSPQNGADEDDRDSVTVVPIVVPRADLSMSVGVDNGNPLVGSLVQLTLRVDNSGPFPASDVAVTAHLPTNLTLVSASGAYSGGVWQVGDIGVNESADLVIQAQVNDVGLATFAVEVTAANPDDTDATPANGDDTEDDYDAVTLVPKSGNGAQIIILNADPPGVGFNDATPAAGVGGNVGTTLGEQRLIAFQYAADLWSTVLQSDVPIVVRANFGNLTCTSSGATLGSAGPETVSRDFANAPVAGTWYTIAQANALAGTDLNGADPEIRASFNGQLDSSSCLGNTGWYYGLDQNPGGDIDLVTVLIHEMGHGLGFLSLMNSGGTLFQGLPDIYTSHLEDHSRNQMLPNLNGSQRAQAAVNSGNLHWVGDFVKAASTHITRGRTSSGHVEMFAPNPYQSGSSVSHYSNNLLPLDFMRAYYAEPNHNMGLSAALMYDLGWQPPSQADLYLDSTVSNPTPNPGDTVTFTLTLSNAGPEVATGVEVDVVIPSGLTYVSDNAGGAFDDTTGIWTPGALPNNMSAALQISVLVEASGDKNLVAEVGQADQSDPNSQPGNGDTAEDDYTRTGLGSADISLDLTAHITDAEVGDIVPMTLSIINSGPDTAHNPAVSITLDAGLTMVSDTSLLWYPANLANGESAHLDFSIRIDDAGSLAVITDLIASDDPDPDSTPNNNHSGEDDWDTHVFTVAQPVTTLSLTFVSAQVDLCPQIRLWMRVTDNGVPVNNLNLNHFNILEDGLPVGMGWIGATQEGDYELAYTSRQINGDAHTLDVRVDVNGETAFFTKTINNCYFSGAVDIANGETIDGIYASPGDWTYFRLQVPPLQNRLVAKVFGGTGDFDLYVKTGAPPTLESFEYRHFFDQPGQSLIIDNPGAGDTFLGIYSPLYLSDVSLFAQYTSQSGSLQVQGAYTDSCPDIGVNVQVTLNGSGVPGMRASHFTLSEDGTSQSFTVTESATPGDYILNYTTDNPNGETHLIEVTAQVSDLSMADSTSYSYCEVSGIVDLENAQVVADLDGAAGSWKYFRLTVPPGQGSLDVRIFGGSGDADLYVRRDILPEAYFYDWAVLTNGNEEAISIDNPPAGTYYIGVYGFNSFAGVNLVAEYEAAALAIQWHGNSAAACPIIVTEFTVTQAGVPVTDLTAGDIAVSDPDSDGMVAESLTHQGNGRYELRHETDFSPNGSYAYFYYQIQITRGSGASIWGFFDTCFPSGNMLQTWINGEHGAPAGSEVVIPVRIDAVEPALGLSQVRFDVSFDPGILTFLGHETTDMLVAPWDFISSEEVEPGRIVVNASDIDQTTISSPEPADLIGLRFRVADTAPEGVCTTLNFDPSFFLFNDGNPIAETNNGQFCVTEGTCPNSLGDVNGDGDDDQAFDALQILNAVSGIPTAYDPLPLCVADTNCSGDITVMDAVLILRKNVALITDYCESGFSRGSGSFGVSIPAEDLTVDVASTFELRVQLDQLPSDPVYGYSFDITYDPALVTLRVDTLHDDTLSSRWTTPVVSEEEGRLTVTQISPVNAVEGTGTLLRIRGTANPINTGVTALHFTRFSVAVDGEAEQSFGPFNLTVGGEPCFRTDLYQTYLDNWPTTTTVRDMIDLFNCNR